MKRELNPKMLYFGTPVVLVSSLNSDGSTNVAPMSSAWWVGKTAMLGLVWRSPRAGKPFSPRAAGRALRRGARPGNARSSAR